MPTTEAPPPESQSKEPQQRPRALRGRVARLGAYDEVESYDLIHIIDELEDERWRVQRREKIYIAIVLHVILFALILFLPKYLPHVQVRDSSEHMKKMTYLDLPPDVLKQLAPKKQAPLSDKNRQQQAPKPMTNPKTLRELEAMRRAGPPVPKPAPPAPKPAPPQVAQQQPAPQAAPQPKATPPPSQSASIEAPKPQPTKPNFSGAPSTPGEAVQQAERSAEHGGTYGGGDMGANAPSQHPGNQGAVDILSDTLGVNFGPYIQRVIYDTKRAWYPIIPEVAQPPISKQGKVLIRFKIRPDGSVFDMQLEGPSGDVSLDRAAWVGITGGGYPPLPRNFKGPFLELRFYFLYNNHDGIR
jgi:TonB family protein